MIDKKEENNMFNNNSGFSMPVVPMGYANGNTGNGSWGDDWLALAALALIFGWGNGGFGGFGGGFGGAGVGGYPFAWGGFPYGFAGKCGSDCATQADVRAAVDQQTLISKIDQQTYGLADSTYALNNAINTGFSGVQQTLCQGFNGVNTAVLQSSNNTERGFANLSSQLAMCCCDIERGIDGVNYNMAKNACDLQNTLHNNTRDIIDNQNSTTRAILDFLVQDKISDLQAENQSLKLKASQADQNAVLRAAIDASTAEIIRRTGNDCPIPAYVVPNPNCCYNPIGFNFGSGYGYNNGGCGCGCA